MGNQPADAESGGFVSKWLQGSKNELLQLVTGKDSTGSQAWYFLLVKDRRHLYALTPALKARTVDLTEFGEILESGYGEEPPEYITDRIKKRFGIV